MKRTIILAVLALALTACSKTDSTDYGNLIIGTWEQVGDTDHHLVFYSSKQVNEIKKGKLSSWYYYLDGSNLRWLNEVGYSRNYTITEIDESSMKFSNNMEFVKVSADPENK